MLCIKSLMFCAFLTFLEARADILGGSHKKFTAHTAALPIALKLSESIQTAKHEFLKSAAEENIKDVANDRSYERLSNDVEVFKEKLGPQMEKQEEEPEPDAEVEEETPPEEPKDDEGEPAVAPEAEVAAEEEAEPAAEPEVEAPAEEEAQPAAEPEVEAPAEEVAEPVAEDVADAAPEAEAEPAAEPEAESPAEPEPKPELENEADVKKEEDDKEMANDEPTKEDNDEEKKDVKENETKSVVTKDTEIKEDSCFSCTSNEDAKCPTKPTQEIKCPKVSKGDEGKHNGCYTLYQADTNTTMRGCVDDLAEEGLKYCLTNDKFCRVCYNNGCNNKEAPSNATKLLFNFYTLLSFNVTFIILTKKFAKFSFI